MHSVLLIRPKEDSLPFAKILKSKGITPFLYPLFKAIFLPFVPPKNPQALIITSKNALRAFQDYQVLKNIPLYVVGDQTASLAHQLGFSKVLSASGTAQDLINLISRTAHPGEGTLWHLSGEVIKRDLVRDLESKGFQAARKVVYQIEGINTLPPPLVSQLQNQEISHVMFFSPQTTALFINLLIKKGLEDNTPQMISLCLSDDVAKKALSLKWKEIWISPKPTTKNMLEYFDG